MSTCCRETKLWSRVRWSQSPGLVLFSWTLPAEISTFRWGLFSYRLSQHTPANDHPWWGAGETLGLWFETKVTLFSMLTEVSAIE